MNIFFFHLMPYGDIDLAEIEKLREQIQNVE